MKNSEIVENLQNKTIKSVSIGSQTVDITFTDDSALSILSEYYYPDEWSNLRTHGLECLFRLQKNVGC